jgi:hypothetical protein
LDHLKVPHWVDETNVYAPVATLTHNLRLIAQVRENFGG